MVNETGGGTMEERKPIILLLWGSNNPLNNALKKQAFNP